MKHMSDVEIFEYAAGQSPTAQLQSFAAHLAVCPACAQQVSEENYFSEAISGLKTEESSPRFTMRLMNEIVRQENSPVALNDFAWRNMLGFAAIIVFAIAAVVSGGIMDLSYGNPHEMNFAMRETPLLQVSSGLFRMLSGFYLKAGRGLATSVILTAAGLIMLGYFDRFLAKKMLK